MPRRKSKRNHESLKRLHAIRIVQVQRNMLHVKVTRIHCCLSMIATTVSVMMLHVIQHLTTVRSAEMLLLTRGPKEDPTRTASSATPSATTSQLLQIVIN